jgi:hypothetical protein
MRHQLTNRRKFLQRAGGIMAAGAAMRVPTGAAGAESGAIRLGGPSFSQAGDPEELALAHRKQGYRAAYCPAVDPKDESRIRDIARAFAVHLDPCNLVNSPQRFYHNTELLNECFDKLGPWIASCHAKDLARDVEMNLHFREVPIGTGQLDYATYLKRLAALPGEVPLMIEHMKDRAEYDRCRDHVVATGKKIGVRFE